MNFATAAAAVRLHALAFYLGAQKLGHFAVKAEVHTAQLCHTLR